VAAEKIGIEGRVSFYEQAGALRDFVQNHLLQLAALTLMEPCPHNYDFADLPERRLTALEQLRPPPPDEFDKKAFRAQYKGYRQEVGNSKSITETFVALELNSRDPRWQGVPIYLATGKNLDQKLTQIRINFKRSSASEANTLILRIQPREAVELDLWVKRPGYERDLQKKTLSFYYEQEFKDRLPDAYEQVLVEAMRSSRTLFTSNDEVLASWQILQPVLARWSMSADNLHFYKPGSSAEEILALKSG
jgi:glucose-6-phosphate 1-dehydrogenase